MSGMANWKAKIELDIKDLQKQLLEAEDSIDKITNEDRKVKLDIDTTILESAVQKLDRMLGSLSKGTGDFKQFENLSKELSSITSDINNISKAFSSMDDGSSFVNNIKSIDASLSTLSQHFVSEISGKMGTAIKNTKDSLSDIGNGQELDPLLQTISKIEDSIKELVDSVKNVNLSMNIDFGSNEELKSKVETKTAGVLHAYESLFNQIKKSGVLSEAEQGIVDNLNIGNFDGMEAKISEYERVIKELRAAQKSAYGKDYLRSDIDNSYWTAVSGAKQALSLAKKSSEKDDVLQNLFSGTDLSEVISQLTIIAEKLDNIVFVSQELKSSFDQGLNVNTSIEDIAKLTDRVKELEDELAKIKTPTTLPSNESNISSGMKDAFPDSSTNTKPETEGMEQVEKATEEAVKAKKDFATANEGVQSFINGSENPLKLEAELMEQIAKSAREAADAKKEFVEANKQVKDSADKSNNDLAGGHSENAEPSGVKKYKKKGYKAHDTGNHDNEKKVSNKAELEQSLRELQSEIIASIDESTSFVKEITDFYDSQNNLVKTQTKVSDKNGSMRTYTHSYSTDKEGNTTAWTSHIETQKYQDQNKIIQEQTKNLQKLSAEKQKAAESERKSAVNQASKDQLEAWKQIQRIRKEIAGTSNDKLIEQLEQEKKTYQEQYLAATKILKNNSDLYNSEQRLNELKKISLKTTQQIESSQQRQFNGYDNKLSGYQGKVSEYSATINKFGDDGWTSPEYLEKVQKAQEALSLYQKAINELKANPDLINKESLANVERLGKDFEDVAFDIKNMTAAQKGYTQLGAEKALDKISQMVKENSKMSRQAKADIKAWYDQIASGNPSASLDVILGKVEEIVRKEKEAGRGGKSMWDKIADKVVFGYAAQLASYFLSFSDFIRYGQQAISIVVDLNTQITELAKVSEQTSRQIYSDFSSYADIAKDVGGTISDTISATSDWARNGYGIPDSKELARVALLYKNVGDGINIDEANESLISTLRGFKLEADQAEHIIDVFNEVSNNESISSAGIGNALQRSAASFNAANTSLEKSVALVTATNSVLQDPEKVGNMWKTNFYCLYVQKCA